MPPEPQASLPLRRLSVRRFDSWPERFPFSIPLIRNLEEIQFDSAVTFLVGENGCGKSTLLEAIACAANSITVGSQPVSSDPSLKAMRSLAKNIHLTWSAKTRKGFFMRSEDFFGFARKMAQTRQELQDDLAQTERDYAGKSETARQFARLPYKNELDALQRSYGEDLDARSHGESFLKLFEARFIPGGLYLLDEPEAPLSPLRQLSFLVLIRQMIAQRAQFIIATHSPILMAYPDAAILHIEGGHIRKAAFEEVEHVQITRTFLENPEAYLRHLFID